jgi:Domain of unknown function (DUF1772)
LKGNGSNCHPRARLRDRDDQQYDAGHTRVVLQKLKVVALQSFEFSSAFGIDIRPAEAMAVISTNLFALWTRRQRPDVFRYAAAAAACVTAAHGIFWGVVQPVNVEMLRWPLDAIPQDWTNWRDRWEYGHAVRAGLATAALGALTLSPVCD